MENASSTNPKHVSNIGVIASAALLIATVADFAIHLIGIGWFGSRLNSCAVLIDLVIVGGLVAGALSRFIAKFRWIRIVVFLLLCMALVAFFLFLSGLKPVCGVDVRVEPPWFSATLIVVYLALIARARLINRLS